jgi:hypothetical protein
MPSDKLKILPWKKINNLYTLTRIDTGNIRVVFGRGCGVKNGSDKEVRGCVKQKTEVRDSIYTPT